MDRGDEGLDQISADADERSANGTGRRVGRRDGREGIRGVDAVFRRTRDVLISVGGVVLEEGGVESGG